MHPEDLVLFDYVEGELPGPRRAEVELHLGVCAQCAEDVAQLQAGRYVLRGSQRLELPPQRREAILLSLPARPRESRGWGISLKQVVAVLSPVALVALVVVALVNVDGNQDDEGAAVGGGGGTAELSAPDDTSGGGETQDESANQQAKSGRVLFLDGPPEDVAAELRAKGFEAAAVGNRVVVRNATRSEVRRALLGRRDGTVRIVIVP